MKNTKSKFILRGIVFGIIAGAVFTLVIMLLWNWLMPTIFSLATINFWQALGILVLSRILFGSGHGQHSFRRNEHDKFWREKFHSRIAEVKARKAQTAEQKPE